MRKSVVLCAAVALTALVCQGAFCEQAAPEKPSKEGAVAPQREELTKLFQRMREINQQLRDATTKARKSEEVKAAFQKVQELQQALEKARQDADKVTDEVVVKQNPDLANLVKERKDIQEKLRKIRGDATRRFIGPPGAEGQPFPGPDRPFRPRVRPGATTEGQAPGQQ